MPNLFDSYVKRRSGAPARVLHWKPFKGFYWVEQEPAAEKSDPAPVEQEPAADAPISEAAFPAEFRDLSPVSPPETADQPSLTDNCTRYEEKEEAKGGSLTQPVEASPAERKEPTSWLVSQRKTPNGFEAVYFARHR